MVKSQSRLTLCATLSERPVIFLHLRPNLILWLLKCLRPQIRATLTIILAFTFYLGHFHIVPYTLYPHWLCTLHKLNEHRWAPKCHTVPHVSKAILAIQFVSVWALSCLESHAPSYVSSVPDRVHWKPLQSQHAQPQPLKLQSELLQSLDALLFGHILWKNELKTLQ